MHFLKYIVWVPELIFFLLLLTCFVGPFLLPARWREIYCQDICVILFTPSSLSLDDYLKYFSFQSTNVAHYGFSSSGVNALYRFTLYLLISHVYLCIYLPHVRQGSEWHKYRTEFGKRLISQTEVSRLVGPINDVTDDFMTKLRHVRDNEGDLVVVNKLPKEAHNWSMEGRSCCPAIQGIIGVKPLSGGVYSSLWETVTELQSVTCHKQSHSVTCHPTQVNGTGITYPGGIEG